MMDEERGRGSELPTWWKILFVIYAALAPILMGGFGLFLLWVGER